MHRCVMENVRKIKIKLENIWIDLMRSIFAPYTSVTFDEPFIAFRILYGPMNLGMIFHALCFGKVKFFVDRYTKSFIWYFTPGLQHLLE